MYVSMGTLSRLRAVLVSAVATRSILAELPCADVLDEHGHHSETADAREERVDRHAIWTECSVRR